MAKTDSPFKCDVGTCNAAKGEVNHWYLVVEVSVAGIRGVALFAWDEKLADMPGALHACGLAHGQMLQAKKADETTKAPVQNTATEDRNTHGTPSSPRKTGEPGSSTNTP
jgi:hypothetical protein